MSEHSLSLYGISQTLAELVAMREEPLLTEVEREAIDGQIREFLAAELRKVDNVRAYLRHCAVMEKAALEEAAEQRRRADVWKNRADRLKTICKAAMETFGARRLEGNTGVLRIQANCGKQALKITRADLVPEQYLAVEGRIPMFVWKPLIGLAIEVATMNGNSEMRKDLEGLRMRTVSQDESIRAALERKCEHCDMGVYRHTVADASGMPKDVEEPCEACNGTGHGIVPGAELEPRGEHLRVE